MHLCLVESYALKNARTFITKYLKIKVHIPKINFFFIGKWDNFDQISQNK